uniref:Uncharacterized protein n=1 Tax=Rhabditophanes sp. KR3021 TaxID=114890 RepID=A0AC35TM27_9BILA
MFDRISLMSIDFSKAVRMEDLSNDSTWLSLDNESEFDASDLSYQNERFFRQPDAKYENNGKIDKKGTPPKIAAKPGNLMASGKMEPSVDVRSGRERESKLPQSTSTRTRSVSRNVMNRILPQKLSTPQNNVNINNNTVTPKTHKPSIFARFTSKGNSNNNTTPPIPPPKPQNLNHHKISPASLSNLQLINNAAKKQEMELMEDLLRARDRIAHGTGEFSRPSSAASNHPPSCMMSSSRSSFECSNKGYKSGGSSNNNSATNLNILPDDPSGPSRGSTPARKNTPNCKSGIPLPSKLGMVRS